MTTGISCINYNLLKINLTNQSSKECRDVVKMNQDEIITKMLKFNSIKIASIAVFYSLSAFLQRQHLFVWSVFAPKLIYQLAHVFIEVLLIFVINFHF